MRFCGNYNQWFATAHLFLYIQIGFCTIIPIKQNKCLYMLGANVCVVNYVTIALIKYCNQQ